MPDPELQQLVEASSRIIPKLAGAAAGEQPADFLNTLAIFARTVCEKYGVPVDRFIEMLHPPRTSS